MRTGSGHEGLLFSKQKQTHRAPKPVITEQRKRNKKRAAAIERIYQANRKKAITREGGGCRCGCGSRDLECHHVTKRSQGRDDRLENLVMLDRRCCHREADRGALGVEPTNRRKGTNGRIRFSRDGSSWIT